MWQYARIGQQLHKAVQLLFCRQLAEQKQIGHLFKAEAFVTVTACDDVFDIHTAVKELAVGGDSLAVYDLILADLADIGQTGQYAATVKVTQTDVDVVLRIEAFIDIVVLNTAVCQLLDPFIIGTNLRHCFTSFFFVVE